jgi:hypothetical protein
VNGSSLFVLNFYSPIFVDQLRSGRKTATIRLGDKSRKYRRGQVVWITIGYRHQPREKIFAAVIDDVEVKKVEELSRGDIEHDNPEFRRREETVDFLEKIYTRPISDEDTVTVIRFSQIVERPSTQFGNGETPSRN